MPPRSGEDAALNSDDCEPSAPIDFAHLNRQTMGDAALRQEVLGLFARQAASVAERIGGAGQEEQRRLAHTLKGAARGIGAWAIAECLAELEQRPGDSAVLARLERFIEDARHVIADLER